MEEDDFMHRQLEVDFNSTLLQLQRLILQAMRSLNMDHNVSAADYVVIHKACAPNSTSIHDGCYCRDKGCNNNIILLRTGDWPAGATLTEMGMLSGHTVQVCIEQANSE